MKGLGYWEDETATAQGPQLDDFKGFAELYLFEVSFTGMKNIPNVSGGGRFSMEIQNLEAGAV